MIYEIYISLYCVENIKNKDMPHFGYKKQLFVRLICSSSVCWCCSILPSSEIISLTPKLVSRILPLPWIREKPFETSSSPGAIFANVMTLKSLTFLFLLVWNKFSSWWLYSVESNSTRFKEVQNVSFQMYTSLFSSLSRLSSRFAFTRKFSKFHTKGREDKRNKTLANNFTALWFLSNDSTSFWGRVWVPWVWGPLLGVFILENFTKSSYKNIWHKNTYENNLCCVLFNNYNQGFVDGLYIFSHKIKQFLTFTMLQV